MKTYKRQLMNGRRISRCAVEFPIRAAPEAHYRKARGDFVIRAHAQAHRQARVYMRLHAEIPLCANVKKC